MNRTVYALIVFLFCSLINPLQIYANDLKASLAYLPKILESPEKGVFVDLVKAIDSVYEGKIQISVYPFPRSLRNIIDGERDFHMPMIRNTLVDESGLPYRYASEKMGDVVFVIYSHPEKPITSQHLNDAMSEDAFPYQIETMRGFENYFEFKIKSLSSLKSGLQKVANQRVDAFIFAQEESDFVVQELKLKNIHREFYKEFDDVIVIPKGKEGDKIDEIISKSIKRLKSDNTWQSLHLKVHQPYQDWQPYKLW